MDKYDKLVKDLKHQVEYLGDESFDFVIFQDTFDELKALHNEKNNYQVIKEILKEYQFIHLGEVDMNRPAWSRPINLKFPQNGRYYLFLKDHNPDFFEIIRCENQYSCDEWNEHTAFHYCDEFGVIFRFNNVVQFREVLNKLEK